MSCVRLNISTHLHVAAGTADMADFETSAIFDQIQALVSDELQVVSYKWLSRNFLVSSNAAKRLLEEFVEKNGSGLEAVYSLSGWLKNNPSVYHIKLVSRPKLEEAKKEFEGSCSVQVYSVQACIPKDPELLWNTEFVQAEELSKQPPAIVNCLRDNRFCGVSNSYVKRNVVGTAEGGNNSQAKKAMFPGPSRSNSVNQASSFPHPQERQIQQSNPKINAKATDRVKDVKTRSNATEAQEQGDKPCLDKEKTTQFPTNIKKGQNDKSSSGTGGSLARMWNQASTKSKPSFPFANKTIPPSSDAQIIDDEAEATADGSSDDDGRGVNFKRGSNVDGSRKRRIVMDFSDEEDEFENAVNLASPDLPKKQSSVMAKQNPQTSGLDRNNLSFDEQKEEKPKIEKEKASDSSPKQLLRAETVGTAHKKEDSSLDKGRSPIPKIETASKTTVSDVAPNSPKRRKLLKTRIDDRGREVTEVVWEGEDMEFKPNCDTAKKKDDNDIVNNAASRPAVPAKKSPAVSAAPSNTAAKAGNKKAGTKDPKQGNIMSFFKKL